MYSTVLRKRLHETRWAPSVAVLSEASAKALGRKKKARTRTFPRRSCIISLEDTLRLSAPTLACKISLRSFACARFFSSQGSPWAEASRRRSGRCVPSKTQAPSRRSLGGRRAGPEFPGVVQACIGISINFYACIVRYT